MSTVDPFQLDLTYKGHDISVMTMPSAEGWRWAAIIDNWLAMEGGDASQPSPEMALDAGKAAIERFIDSDDASQMQLHK